MANVGGTQLVFGRGKASGGSAGGSAGRGGISGQGPGGRHLADTAGLGRVSTPATRPGVSDKSVRPTVGMGDQGNCVCHAWGL